MEDVGEDRISKLPEPLIHHVLSLLPTKCAVSTTVLSKTWKNLWVSIPVFDFREWRPIKLYALSKTWKNLQEDTDRFMDSLDSTLFSINNISTIQKFCLNLDTSHFVANRVREWLTALIERKVEELVLEVTFPKPNMVPSNLITCKSLTMLDLNFKCQHVLDIPHPICLPKLKVLRLSRIEFKDVASTQQLFSNCPVLEELVLYCCSKKDSDITSFSAPLLKIFALKGGSLSMFHQNHHLIRIEIDAPNLVSVEYGGLLLSDFLLGSFPSLVEVDFRNARDNGTSTLDSLTKFIKMCSNMKLLKASSEYVKIFDIANVPSATFDHLVRLELVSDSPYFKIYLMRSFIKFLHFSPNLESLVINQVRFIKEVNELVLDQSPHCLLSSLKSIELRIYERYPEDTHVVKLLLKYARVLEMVVIRGRRLLDPSSEMFQQIQNFPRASTHCSFQLLE